MGCWGSSVRICHARPSSTSPPSPVAGGGRVRASPAMDSETSRRRAHALVVWMANYMDGVERYPVRAQVGPGEIASRLPLSPPREGEAIESIFRDFERDLLPGVTHWQHPSFFAYFPANASPPSILAEMLTPPLGLHCMIWHTSPAATELEARAMEWLRQMLGLPDGFTGVIHDSAAAPTLSPFPPPPHPATTR